MLYISDIRHSKLKRFSKIDTFKKIRLYRLWRSSYAISVYKQAFKVHTPPLLMCFEYSKLHDIKKWQRTRKEIQKFLKQTDEVSIKTFCRKWEGETLRKWPFILQMTKQILSLQSKFNKFYADIFFPYNKFVCYVCLRGNFFSKLYRDGIKNVLRNIWRMIRMGKTKDSYNNF